MDKTDFIEVNPPLGPIIVLQGSIYLISPGWDDGKLAQLDLHTVLGDLVFMGDDAKSIAKTLNARFGLHIGVRERLEPHQKVVR